MDLRQAAAAFILFAVMAGTALCQVNTPKPAFDLADVHPTPESEMAGGSVRMDGGVLGGDRYAVRRATMLGLIWLAYGVNADKVFGGPTWIGYDRFDLIAKTAPGTPPATLRLMLQNLLTDRFHLVLKADTRPVPGFLLTKVKSELNLDAAAESAKSGACQTVQSPGNGPPVLRIQCRNATMDSFAAFLSGPARPVVNSTGIDGAWDFDLPYELGHQAEALAKVGLKLEPGNVPGPVLTVVNAEHPLPNPAMVADALPPLPEPRFEVAAIRLCDRNSSGGTMMPFFQPGGHVTANCSPPGGLIVRAWNLPGLPVGLPKSFDGTTAFNVSITATAPSGIATDNDTLNAMMRALLTERYTIKFHYEDRPVDAYSLVAAKPKLAKADPEGRTGCTFHSGTAPGRSSTIQLDCRNMTMAQFVDEVRSLRAIQYPVKDATGLKGAWDFTLDYDTSDNRSSRSGTDGEPQDPNGSSSFEDALTRQLGLRLEKSKRPEPVFVIDHMEEKPTEN